MAFDKIMTTKELANYIKLNEKTVLKMAQNNELPGIKVGNQWRFQLSSIDKHMQNEIIHAPSDELDTIIQTTDHVIPVSRLMDQSLIHLDRNVQTGNEVLTALSELAYTAGITPDKENLYVQLKEREKMLSTALGHGVAVPHPRIPSKELFQKPNIMLIRSKKGVDFGAPDKEKVHLFFMTCAPSIFMHLRLLAKIAKLLKIKDIIAQFMDASDKMEIIRILLEQERMLIG